MDLRQLRYFVAVAEHQHFSRAAAALDISPPTLTVQIQALERDLCTQLLLRRGKRIFLTDAGKRFQAEAVATLKQAERAEQIARQTGLGQIGTVSVGFVLAVALSGRLSQAISAYMKAKPGVIFRLKRQETIETMRQLIARDLDVGIVRAPTRFPAELSGFSLSTDPFFLAAPRGHPLTRRKRITLEALAGYPYVAAGLETEIGFKGNIATLASSVLAPVSSAPASEVVSVLTLVAAGAGISIVSLPTTRAGVPNVVFRPIKDLKPGAELVVVYRKDQAMPQVLGFIDVLRHMAKR